MDTDHWDRWVGILLPYYLFNVEAINIMEETKDIITLEDIKTLVDAFYEKVKKDELLAPIFNERIQDRWPQHLKKMYAFWQTVLLDERTYVGSPFPPHAQLPVDHSHFKRW